MLKLDILSKAQLLTDLKLSQSKEAMEKLLFQFRKMDGKISLKSQFLASKISTKVKKLSLLVLDLLQFLLPKL
jgi:hypothetical protein